MEQILYFVLRLLLSLVLGGILGWQRERIGKAAGPRTYALVALGSTLFTLLSLTAFGSADPAKVAAQIITGIGFLGAGVILHKQGTIEGITTAAGLWAVAAVGMAVGVGWYWQAVVATVLMYAVFLVNDDKLAGRKKIF